MKVKKLLGVILSVCLITTQLGTFTALADTTTTSNPTAKINLGKTVEKNQWAVGDEFTINYTIQPQDIPQSAVPPELYHKNGADISLVIDTSGSMAWDLNGNQISNTPTYVADNSGSYVRAYNAYSYWGSLTRDSSKYTYLIYDKNSNTVNYNNTNYVIKYDSVSKYNYIAIPSYWSTTYKVLDLNTKYKLQDKEQSRLEIVQNAANNFINKFSNYSNVRIGLINYSTSATKKEELTNNSAFNQITTDINSLGANGATNIGDGLRKAYWQLKNNSSSDKKQFVVLLTDGEPNKRSYYYVNGIKTSVTDSRDSFDGTDGDGNSDTDGTGLKYANLIAGNIGADKTNNTLNVNSFMIAFSKDATNNKLKGISNIASNNQPGFYKEATTADDLNEIYDQIAQTILSDLPIYGLQLKETFPSGISIVRASNGLTINSTTNSILGDIGNINYKLVNGVFKADPVNFWVTLKGTSPGNYTLGRDSSGNSTSFVTYKDIDGKDVVPAPSFPNININIYNTQPPSLSANLLNNDTNSSYNLSVNVDKLSNINIKSKTGDTTVLTSQSNVNNTATLSMQPTSIKNNLDSNIYSLCIEAIDASNSTLKTVETVPLITADIVKDSNNNSINDLVIKTESNSTINTIMLNGTVIDSNKITDNGQYVNTIGNLKDGDNVITVTVANSYNNTTTMIFHKNMDTTAPAAPVITAPTSGVTNNNKPTIVGTGEAGASLTVYDGTTEIGTTTVSSDGSWSLALTTALTDGTHTITAKQSDAGGNVSPSSNAVNLMVDTAAPAAPVITSPTSGVTNNNKPTIVGTGEAGASLTVYDGTTAIGTTTVSSDGSWSLTLTTALTDGTHTITAKQSDAAGNVSPSSNAVNLTVDTAVSAPVITSPKDGAITNNNKPTITGTGEKGATVTVYDTNGTTVIGTATVDGSGNWSITPSTALADGDHTITAKQTDGAGNVSGSSTPVKITIDTTVSSPVITTPTDGTVTKNNRPTISGTGEKGATVTVYDTNGTTVIGTATVDGSGNWSMTPSTGLADGDHTITAKQTDGAGNISGSSNAVKITIDTAVPAAPVITSPTSGVTNNNKPTIIGTGEAGATVTVYDGTTAIGTATVKSDGSWSLTLTTALTDGTHTITAKQSDAAGNVSPSSNAVNLTIDTAVPAAPVITSPTSGVTNNNKPTIIGTGEAGATLTVYDGTTAIGTTTVSSDGSWSLTLTTALTDGAHTITAKQNDAAGNISPSSNAVNLTIDTAVSAPVITSPKDGAITNNNKPTITGTGEKGATVTVYDTDGTTVIGTATVDSSGNWSLTPSTGLADGDHTITAKQTDGAGNVSESSNAVKITIETTPSSILKQGIYMSNNANNEYISTNSNSEFDVVKNIPVNVAMIVDVQSSNPQISLTIDGNLKNTSIKFNKYKVTKDSATNKYTIVPGSILQSYTTSSYSQGITFTNNSKFSLDKGSQYIIFYSLTPNGNKGQKITISAAVDSANPAPPIKLNVQDLPSVQ